MVQSTEAAADLRQLDISLVRRDYHFVFLIDYQLTRFIRGNPYDRHDDDSCWYFYACYEIFGVEEASRKILICGARLVIDERAPFH